MRYVTNEQRRRRTLFKPTLWAVASCLIFGVAHSLRAASVSRRRYGRRSVGEQNWCGMLVVTASPPRTALKISQLIRQPPDAMPPTYDSMH